MAMGKGLAQRKGVGGGRKKTLQQAEAEAERTKNSIFLVESIYNAVAIALALAVVQLVSVGRAIAFSVRLK